MKYSGLNHIGHMGACVAMLAWAYENRPEIADDRHPNEPRNPAWRANK